MEITEYELKAKLAGRKNTLRKALAEMGVLERGGQNNFDKYKYFSEAQYKELFTSLFSKYGLELTSNVISYTECAGTEKQPFGRIVAIEFTLTDVATGYSESSVCYGEGMDKGDKAGYKAFTGAVKYFLANTFLVATGDDPETESQDGKKNTAPAGATKKATEGQLNLLRTIYQGENLAKLLSVNGLEKLEDMTMAKASELIERNKARR